MIARLATYFVRLRLIQTAMRHLPPPPSPYALSGTWCLRVQLHELEPDATTDSSPTPLKRTLCTRRRRCTGGRPRGPRGFDLAQGGDSCRLPRWSGPQDLVELGIAQCPAAILVPLVEELVDGLLGHLRGHGCRAEGVWRVCGGYAHSSSLASLDTSLDPGPWILEPWEPPSPKAGMAVWSSEPLTRADDPGPWTLAWLVELQCNPGPWALGPRPWTLDP